MVERRTLGDYLFDTVNVIFLVLLTVVTLYPFLYIIFSSLSDPTSLMEHRGVLLYPLGFSLNAYKSVVMNPMIISGYQNTLFVVLVGTALNLLMTSMGAYVTSRQYFILKRPLILMIMVTMYFGGGLIPNYLLVRNLGMIDSLWALIFPNAIGAWNLFIMRSFFMGIPASLEESARIDGAGEMTILLRIVLPLSVPVIAVMILYYGVGHWNAWFNAMIYVRTRLKYPLQLILREIVVASQTASMSVEAGIDDQMAIGETIKYATIIVATLPILVAYPWLQKYFVKGVMLGAIKG